MKKILQHIELTDAICLVGLLFLGIGLWWYEPWVSFTAVGSLLIAISIAPSVLSWMARRRDR